MAKKQNTEETIDSLLEKISNEDLKGFLKEQMDNNELLKQTFLTNFAHLNSGQPQKIYNKQIKSVLNAAKDRGGFINWSAARFVGSAVGNIVNTAYKQVQDGNVKSAAFICFAVMEEMVKALQFADDSGGDIGGNIDSAFSLLTDISKSNPPEDIRSFLFDECLKHFRDNSFEGWNWHLGMLGTASTLVKNEGEADKVISLLDQFIVSDKKGYSLNEAQKIKYFTLRNGKDIKKAEDFLEENLQNPMLRKIAIQDSIASENFKRASQLSLEGIEIDAKSWPGRALEWYDWLLQISILQNDKPEIISHARHLFIHSFYNRQEYYEVLKKYVPKKEWNSFVENLVSDIRGKGPGLDFDHIANVYITEKLWDRLFGLLAEAPALSRVEHMEQYLAEKYSAQLAELYEPLIIEFLKEARDRKDYRVGCRYLKRMLKLGARERVNKLIEKIRETYPNRRALQDELRLVK
ncbi:MAG TPA: hypothetical protein VHO03_07535 [Ignavibacteriales bacterium]|nr:hypothetical protein [Ignavibacteriales bacterium]